MPAVNFIVSWPDGEQSSYYSPSTIIKEKIKMNKEYSVDEFSNLVDSTLKQASERVREKYGFYCSRSTEENHVVQKKVNQLKQSGTTGSVKVIAFR